VVARREGRRQFLGAACRSVAVLTGCGLAACAPQVRSQTQPVQKSTLFIGSVALFPIAAAIEQGFAKAHPKAPFALSVYKTNTFRRMDRAGNIDGSAPVAAKPDEWLALDPYLKATNMDVESMFLPGILDPYRVKGSIYALPLVLRPMCMQYFGTVPQGITDWNAFFGALRTGGMGALNAGTFVDIAVWSAFVAGAGGTVVQADGQIDLTGPATVKGLGLLVDILKAGQADWQCQGAVGVWQVNNGNLGGKDLQRQLAMSRFGEFPAFPTGPLVPYRQEPFIVAAPNNVKLGGGPPYEESVPFYLSVLQWLYEPPQQELLMTVALPPVVNDPELSRAWETAGALAPSGVAAATPVGAYRNVFAPAPKFYDSWSLGPPAFYVGCYLAACALGKDEFSVTRLADLNGKLNSGVALLSRPDYHSDGKTYQAIWAPLQAQWGFPDDATGLAVVPWSNTCV